jgi:hypothetical protein
MSRKRVTMLYKVLREANMLLEVKTKSMYRLNAVEGRDEVTRAM